MLCISNRIILPDSELNVQAVRAQGVGGQHVNKISIAVHLRFDINRSSLLEEYKARLLALRDRRITGDAVLMIKAQQQRILEKNYEDTLAGLRDLILSISAIPKTR